jgi:hypothetical protein
MSVGSMLVVVVLAIQSPSCDGLDPDRAANVFEIGYSAIARERRDAALCYKIAPGAYSMAGFNPPGYQVAFLRSECLSGVAYMRHDPSLCDDVQSISTSTLDGSATTAEACRAAAMSTGSRYSAGSPDEELFLRVLGYVGPSDPPSVDADLWYVDLYLNVVRTAEFGQRAERLPDFSQGDETARSQAYHLISRCQGGTSKDRVCELIECALIRNSKERYDCSRRM